MVGVEHVISDPSFIYNPAPVYPRRARKRGEEGMVILNVTILSDGTVGAVSVYSSSNSQLIDKSALKAVSKWRFEPAQFRRKVYFCAEKNSYSV